MKILRTDTWTLEGMDPAFQESIKSFEVKSDRQHYRRWDIPDGEWLIIALKSPQCLSISDYQEVRVGNMVMASNCWIETQSVDSGDNNV